MNKNWSKWKINENSSSEVVCLIHIEWLVEAGCSSSKNWEYNCFPIYEYRITPLLTIWTSVPENTSPCKTTNNSSTLFLRQTKITNDVYNRSMTSTRVKKSNLAFIWRRSSNRNVHTVWNVLIWPSETAYRTMKMTECCCCCCKFLGCLVQIVYRGCQYRLPRRLS